VSVVERWVLASGNRHKLAELQALVAGCGIELVPQDALGVGAAEETAPTFVENAIAKARHAARQTGLPALADDSGLAVDGLGGAPGVHSARFAGPDADDRRNVEKLLAALAARPQADRGAAFHCVLVALAAADDPAPIVASGVWRGRIVDSPRGSGGFGYDPVFLVPRLGVTAAELAPATKNRLSHRGRAARRLRAALTAARRGR